MVNQTLQKEVGNTQEKGDDIEKKLLVVYKSYNAVSFSKKIALKCFKNKWN